MDDDLYSDLPEGTTSDYIAELENKVKALEAKIIDLEKIIASHESNAENLQKQFESVQQENNVLRTNISSLYRTAKAEIKRKEERMEEYRKLSEHSRFKEHHREKLTDAGNDNFYRKRYTGEERENQISDEVMKRRSGDEVSSHRRFTSYHDFGRSKKEIVSRDSERLRIHEGRTKNYENKKPDKHSEKHKILITSEKTKTECLSKVQKLAENSKSKNQYLKKEKVPVIYNQRSLKLAVSNKVINNRASDKELKPTIKEGLNHHDLKSSTRKDERFAENKKIRIRTTSGSSTEVDTTKTKLQKRELNLSNALRSPEMKKTDRQKANMLSIETKDNRKESKKFLDGSPIDEALKTDNEVIEGRLSFGLKEEKTECEKFLVGCSIANTPEMKDINTSTSSKNQEEKKCENCKNSEKYCDTNNIICEKIQQIFSPRKPDVPESIALMLNKEVDLRSNQLHEKDDLPKNPVVPNEVPLLNIKADCKDGKIKNVTHCTPMKLENGEILKLFHPIKLISPLAGTPDHIKVRLYYNDTKVDPVPMLNEFRKYDEEEVNKVEEISIDKNVINGEKISELEIEDSHYDCNITINDEIEHGIFKRKRKRKSLK